MHGGSQKLTFTPSPETPNLLAKRKFVLKVRQWLKRPPLVVPSPFWSVCTFEWHKSGDVNLAQFGGCRGGGAVGSVSRYLITCLAATIPGGSTMLGTTMANILGCAAIGALGEYSLIDDALSERLKLAIRVGFLGGLTTFSTFAAESASMAGANRWGGAGIYVAANLFIGWAALLVGAAIVKGWTT